MPNNVYDVINGKQYDRVVNRQEAEQAVVADRDKIIVQFSNQLTGSSLGHIQTITTTDQTYFKNITPTTRRWMINACVAGSDNIFSLTGAIQTGKVGPYSTAITDPRYGYNRNYFETTAGKSNRVTISDIVDVEAGDAIAIWIIGDTADGSTWKLSGTNKTKYSTITITELPM